MIPEREPKNCPPWEMKSESLLWELLKEMTTYKKILKQLVSFGN